MRTKKYFYGIMKQRKFIQMQIDENIRWKYRYDGDFKYKLDEFEKTLDQFKLKIKKEETIGTNDRKKFFELFKSLFEGAVRTLRDYLSYEGIFHSEPIDIIKEYFYFEIIKDGQTWINMLFGIETMFEETFPEITIKIIDCFEKSYLPVFKDLDKFFVEEFQNCE